MSARLDRDWSYRGTPAVVMENDALAVTLLPELGGKVWQLRHKSTDTELLWHNPRIRPRPVPFGAGYDDVFAGGWDELFPNDEPESLGGEPYPDHGEVWSLPWDWDVISSGPGRAEVRLSLLTPISGCRLEKSVVLPGTGSRLVVRSRLTNTTARPLPYLWKQHVAVPIAAGDRVDLPATSMYVEHFGEPRTGRTGFGYEWPHAPGADGATHDMRIAPRADSGVAEFQYATGLTAGWCAVTRTNGVGLGLAFDDSVFRSCWTFASYGGWRGLEVLILEPCTGHPVSVTAGVESGTHFVLAPGQTVATEFTAVAYEGVAGVKGIGADGSVLEDG
jgi:hypothetical protein